MLKHRLEWMKRVPLYALPVLLLVVCGGGSLPIDQFEATFQPSGAMSVTLGLETDLPDDAKVDMTVVRFFQVEGESQERPVTIVEYSGTVGELRDGLKYNLTQEGRDFEESVRQRLSDNRQWGAVTTAIRHQVEIVYAPGEGLLTGAAVDEGQEEVRSKIEFRWGRSKELTP